jgi:hybrid cluster-associated redox disulfide protein
MITVLSVLIAVVALGMAAITFFRQRFLRDSLRDAQRRLYLAQARLNELETTLQKELHALRSLLRWQSGGSVFDPSMKITDAIAIDPRIRDVFAQFHLGGCSSCAINEEHTIEQAAMSYGLDLDRLMAALTGLGNGQETVTETPRRGGLLQLTKF